MEPNLKDFFLHIFSMKEKKKLAKFQVLCSVQKIKEDFNHFMMSSQNFFFSVFEISITN